VGAAEAEAVVDLLEHGQQMVELSRVLAAVRWIRGDPLGVGQQEVDDPRHETAPEDRARQESAQPRCKLDHMPDAAAEGAIGGRDGG
jgi:hypothetical protein